MDEELKRKILEENIKLHKIESNIYRQIHADIYNLYEQRRIKKDVDLIMDTIQKENPSVLDVGCGTGNILLKFLKLNAVVTGVDISKEMLDELLKYVSGSATLITSDAGSFIKEELKNNKKYDIISFSSVLHHLPDYLDTVTNACNLVNEGGGIYIVFEHPLSVERKANLLYRIWSFADEEIYRWRLRIKGVKHPSISCYEYADYHVWQGERGINQEKICRILEENCFKIVKYEEYILRRNGIFALVDNMLKINPPNIFSLIAQKLE